MKVPPSFPSIGKSPPYAIFYTLHVSSRFISNIPLTTPLSNILKLIFRQREYQSSKFVQNS